MQQEAVSKLFKHFDNYNDNLNKLIFMVILKRNLCTTNELTEPLKTSVNLNIVNPKKNQFKLKDNCEAGDLI